MKQLIIAFSMLMFISFQSNAQTATGTTKKSEKPAMEKSSCCSDSTDMTKNHDKMMKEGHHHGNMTADSTKMMGMKDHNMMNMQGTTCSDSCKGKHDHTDMKTADGHKGMHKDGKMMKDQACTDSCKKDKPQQSQSDKTKATDDSHKGHHKM